MQRIRCDSAQKVKEALPGLRKQLQDEGAQRGSHYSIPKEANRITLVLRAETCLETSSARSGFHVMTPCSPALRAFSHLPSALRVHLRLGEGEGHQVAPH